MRLLELDTALTEKGIDICTLQETQRDGLNETKSENYIIYPYGECSGHCEVGFAIQECFEHLVTATRGIPYTVDRLMIVDILLTDTSKPTTLICCYPPPNTSPAQVRHKFYTQLESIVTPNTWLLGDFNACAGRILTAVDALWW